MLPVALEYPPGMVFVCTVSARAGRSCDRFRGYKTINRILLSIYLSNAGCNKEYRPVYVHDITDISNYNHFYSKLFSK